MNDDFPISVVQTPGCTYIFTMPPHIVNARIVAYMRLKGGRIGYDFTTVGCLSCFEPIDTCHCKPSLEERLNAERSAKPIK